MKQQHVSMFSRNGVKRHSSRSHWLFSNDLQGTKVYRKTKQQVSQYKKYLHLVPCLHPLLQQKYAARYEWNYELNHCAFLVRSRIRSIPNFACMKNSVTAKSLRSSENIQPGSLKSIWPRNESNFTESCLLCFVVWASEKNQNGLQSCNLSNRSSRLLEPYTNFQLARIFNSSQWRASY